MENCTICGEPVKPFKDKHGDLFTHICKNCHKESEQ